MHVDVATNGENSETEISELTPRRDSINVKKSLRRYLANERFRYKITIAHDSPCSGVGQLLAIAGGCGISGERFFEHLAPTEKAAHDRSERNVEFFGDFFIRELLQIGQDDDRFEFV